ncbi:MAG: acetyl-CoA carboxylase biotin carboxyl carrier protein [Bacteroidetes bacterium]|nr:MAG: acetyl-CoA carboxylase biotin carboxyl carrier protein [Bacteroidota bacterium]PTM11993.1 MAG: acetyl-CoA carboxylase biotin carboxyl carrier protein [Bacteroidota bacterium]
MSTKELHELLKLINRLELSEFKMKEGDFSLAVRTKHFVQAESQYAAPAQLPAAPLAASLAPPVSPAAAHMPAASQAGDDAKTTQEDGSNYVFIKSPMVGTFYRSPSPDKPIYVKIGDTIAPGDTVCIIEAMKLFNEVDSEIAGKIVKVLVEDAQPVEYDQVLFWVDPKG